jgi:hypothetical protein
VNDERVAALDLTGIETTLDELVALAQGATGTPSDTERIVSAARSRLVALRQAPAQAGESGGAPAATFGIWQSARFASGDGETELVGWHEDETGISVLRGTMRGELIVDLVVEAAGGVWGLVETPDGLIRGGSTDDAARGQPIDRLRADVLRGQDEANRAYLDAYASIIETEVADGATTPVAPGPAGVGLSSPAADLDLRSTRTSAASTAPRPPLDLRADALRGLATELRDQILEEIRDELVEKAIFGDEDDQADAGRRRPAERRTPPQCVGCGRELHDDARFCGGCGAEQPRPAGALVCPACGRESVAPEARFCAGCGGRLAG